MDIAVTSLAALGFLIVVIMLPFFIGEAVVMIASLLIDLYKHYRGEL